MKKIIKFKVMKKKIIFFALAVFFADVSFAQNDTLLNLPTYQIDTTIVVSSAPDSSQVNMGKKELYPTKSIYVMYKVGESNYHLFLPKSLPEKIDLPDITIPKKNGLLAATFSILLPGSGQFYNESYWTMAAFLVVETAAILLASKWDSKGDLQTKKFQAYADENWSPVKYARFTVNNIARILAITNPSKNPDDLEVYKVFNPDGSLNWYHLNRVESEIGGYYSHKLALPGEQQYYEMIGKYAQFNPGWKEFPDTLFFKFGDPLTSQFLYYAKMRGKANDYYAVASTFVKIIVANHFLSAIEAAYGSYLYNKNMKIYFSLEKREYNFYSSFDVYPQINLTLRF